MWTYNSGVRHWSKSTLDTSVSTVKIIKFVHDYDWMNGVCPVIVLSRFSSNRSVQPRVSSKRFYCKKVGKKVVTQTPTHITVPGHSHYSGTWGSRWKVPVKPSDPHRGRILWQKQSVTWRGEQRITLRKPLMRGDFVSVTLLSCDLLSPSRSLTDETLSVMPLSEWSYTRRRVSRWLMDSKGHDGWDIKLCTVQRI